MHSLPPASLYRLQILAKAGPRLYQANVHMRRLAALRLVIATGRTGPGERSVEYRITDAGLAELAERYEPVPPLT